jgi:hypothetical protein
LDGEEGVIVETPLEDSLCGQISLVFIAFAGTRESIERLFWKQFADESERLVEYLPSLLKIPFF